MVAGVRPVTVAVVTDGTTWAGCAVPLMYGVITNCVTGEPPSSAGRIQLNRADEVCAVTAMMVGAVGSAIGTAALERGLAGPVPASLTAATVNVHVPLAGEIFTARLVADASNLVGAAALPLRNGVTTYPVILLPFSAGLRQLTAARSPRLPACGRFGAAGFLAAFGRTGSAAFAEPVTAGLTGRADAAGGASPGERAEAGVDTIADAISVMASADPTSVRKRRDMDMGLLPLMRKPPSRKEGRSPLPTALSLVVKPPGLDDLH